LTRIANLTKLQSLDANAQNVRGYSGTQVTDAGLKKIAQLTNLHKLDIGATSITDAGLAQSQKPVSLLCGRLCLGATSNTGSDRLSEKRGLETPSPSVGAEWPATPVFFQKSSRIGVPPGNRLTGRPV
jgi:hypothetical protein